MPKITRMLELEITPERYLDACSVTELQELEVLLNSPRYQSKITAEKRQQKLFNTTEHGNHPTTTN